MPELLKPIGKRVENEIDSPEVFRSKLVDLLLAPEPLPLTRGRSRVWLARAKADGKIIASWTGSARPDAATALPGYTAATLEILEMPPELVETRGGRRKAARDAVSGQGLLDPFGQGRGMRDRWGQAVTDALAPTNATLLTSTRILDAARKVVTVSGSGFRPLFSVPIPGGTLGTTKILRGEYAVRRTTGAGTATVRVSYGGTVMVTHAVATSAVFLGRFFLFAAGAVSSQRVHALLADTALGVDVVTGTAAQDSTRDLNLDVELDLGTDTDVFTGDFVVAVLESL